MTTLTAVEVAGYWEGAGGPKSRNVEWVAIAIGESSLDDAAVSPAGAIGLWQVMPFNASIGGGTVADLYDPAYNARVTVMMSGGGTNCAAWDSAYLNIYASGRYTFLAWPEPGSADYNNLAVASAMLGGQPINPVGHPGYPGIAGTLAATVADVQQQAAGVLPAMTQHVQAVTATLQAMYR